MTVNPASVAPANLPIPRSAFIGRRSEIGAIRRLLLDDFAALVTLVGPAGVGKTRLALEAANGLTESFTDGVTLVRLDTYSDPDQVIPALAQALGVRQIRAGALLEDVIACLRRQQRLLVFDNFEHVLPASAEVSQLLTACPTVQSIATSRCPLQIDGEHELPVPPLPFADPAHLPALSDLQQLEANRLFLRRAKAVDPSFSLNDGNTAHVAKLCACLDGLPLAIEIAATRIKSLTPAQMCDDLSCGLSWFGRGAASRPERHRSLEAAIEWSYRLLGPDAQHALRRLAVFTESFSLPAARAVISASGTTPQETIDRSDAVDVLLTHSLIYRASDTDTVPRFRMLETVRQFGLDRLAGCGDERFARRAHAAWFLALARSAESEVRLGSADRYQRTILVDYPNICAALGWLVENDGEASTKLAENLPRY